MKFILIPRKLIIILGVRWAYRLCTKNLFRIPQKKKWHSFFRILPISKRVIFFESHRGLSYSDNPKAICEAIISSKLPIRCVWSLEDTNLVVPVTVKKVKRFSIPYYYYHACARILIHNGEFTQNLPIRKNQTYVNTQHGTPLKLMGIDIPKKRLEVSLEEYSKDGRWNYLISPNSYSTEIFRRAYLYSGPILEVGYPRNDIFHSRCKPEHVVAIKEKLGLPLDKKVMLYAPTWRDSGNRRMDRDFKLRLDLRELFEQFGNSHVIVLRLHHLISSANFIESDLSFFVFEFSSAQYDVQEIMLVSDVLITDYSSMMFDYANLCRPIIFFAYDFAEYSTEIRGTYFDLKTHSPGPVVECMNDLIQSIRTIETWTLEFSEKQISFHEKFCSLESGIATQRVIDEIIKPEIGIN